MRIVASATIVLPAKRARTRSTRAIAGTVCKIAVMLSEMPAGAASTSTSIVREPSCQPTFTTTSDTASAAIASACGKPR